MSLDTRKFVRCDAPGCGSSVVIPNTTLVGTHSVPMHWLRIRIWDTSEPWESREYDACSMTCLHAIASEAIEIRGEFENNGRESGDGDD